MLPRLRQRWPQAVAAAAATLRLGVRLLPERDEGVPADHSQAAIARGALLRTAQGTHDACLLVGQIVTAAVLEVVLTSTLPHKRRRCVVEASPPNRVLMSIGLGDVLGQPRAVVGASWKVNMAPTSFPKWSQNALRNRSQIQDRFLIGV